jgi:hypothetical protein
MKSQRLVFGVVTLLGMVASSASATVLFDNGPLITNPAGGTSSIAGQPISQPERLARPGDGALVQTLAGRTARAPLGHSVADDFTVPAPGWDLDSLTVYGYESITGSNPLLTTTIDRVHVNLWTATPYSANSPAPVPDPLPQPVLAQKLVLPVTSSSLVGFRTANATSTASIGRSIFALTVSLDGLPDAGELAAGTYWLEWSLEDESNPSANLNIPLVTPRASAPDADARQFNYIGFGPQVNSWFEPRDGFATGISDGLSMAFPFSLSGSVVPEPSLLGTLALATLALRRRR